MKDLELALSWNFQLGRPSSLEVQECEEILQVNRLNFHAFSLSSSFTILVVASSQIVFLEMELQLILKKLGMRKSKRNEIRVVPVNGEIH